MTAVNLHNSNKDGKVTRIETLRVCLISGGLFRHRQVAKLDVAVALVKGISEGFRCVCLFLSCCDCLTTPSPSISPHLNFAYDEGVFEQAYTLLEDDSYDFVPVPLSPSKGDASSSEVSCVCVCGGE